MTFLLMPLGVTARSNALFFVGFETPGLAPVTFRSTSVLLQQGQRDAVISTHFVTRNVLLRCFLPRAFLFLFVLLVRTYTLSLW